MELRMAGSEVARGLVAAVRHRPAAEMGGCAHGMV